MTKINDDDPSGKRFDHFIEELGNEARIGLQKVSEKGAEIAMESARRHLSAIRRAGKLNKYRTHHLDEDVQLFKKGQKYQIGGGKETGTLWHIVNDGTYRSIGYHFMEKIVEDINSRQAEMWEAGEKELEG